MKQLLLLFIAAGIAATAGAQNSEPLHIHLKEKTECGFDKVIQKLNVPYSVLVNAYRPANAPSTTAAKGAGIVYDIPVVFHIIYGPGQASFNLPDSIIQNQYFGDGNGDIDSLERIKKTAEGGKDPWPTKRYLNIWIANLSDSVGQIGVLGYAIPPLNPIPANWPAGADQDLLTLTDGVVLQTHAVGANNSLSPALQGLYTKGRCAVHEVGHYLGLMHIFGSNGGGTGSCGAMADDGINDTPEQSQISFTNSGCPSATKNTCGAGTPGDLPDMNKASWDGAVTEGVTKLIFNLVMKLLIADQTSVATLRSTEERTLNIYLPAGYDSNKAGQYPVIYLLDGSMNEDFLHITGLVQFFQLMMNMPNTIVVGIANVDRKRDFTFPTTIAADKKQYPTTGHSESFIRFMEQELQPYIQSHYKTSATKYLIGQSLGGLVATEILLKKPSLFTHYIIVSPSLWWDNESLLQQAPALLARQGNDSIRVMISVGKEGKIMEQDAAALATTLKNAGPKHRKIDFNKMLKENHATILHLSVYESLKQLFPYKEN
ncbi:putative esterase [Ostertagia ostertagi]